MKLLYLIPLLLSSTVLWEHSGKHYETKFRPSVILADLATRAQQCWSWLGMWAGVVSSWLARIDLARLFKLVRELFGELWKSACDVFKPLVDLFFSWTYFFKGYWNVMLEYAHPLLVPVGGALLVAALLYVCYRLKVHQKLYTFRVFRFFGDCLFSCCKDCCGSTSQPTTGETVTLTRARSKPATPEPTMVTRSRSGYMSPSYDNQYDN
jgi:hypothetical protein